MIEYREITIEHLADIVNLFIETFNTPPWNDQWTIETASKRLSAIIKIEDFYGISAYQEGQLCGMIIGHKEQYYNGMMFQIKEFCVSNKMRGQGIGSKIFCEFQNRLEIFGVSEIILLTMRGDQTEPFYNKHGFKTYDEMILMGKKL